MARGIASEQAKSRQADKKISLYVLDHERMETSQGNGNARIPGS